MARTPVTSRERRGIAALAMTALLTLACGLIWRSCGNRSSGGDTPLPIAVSVTEEGDSAGKPATGKKKSNNTKKRRRSERRRRGSSATETPAAPRDILADTVSQFTGEQLPS